MNNKEKKEKKFTNMMQIQKQFFPNSVDKSCPCCGRPYDKVDKVEERIYGLSPLVLAMKWLDFFKRLEKERERRNE